MLNEKLAYRPWSIDVKDIQFLVKQGNDPSENWSINEVLKASIILSTYHGLCGLSHGMGLVPDYDIIQTLYQLVDYKALELMVSSETLQNSGVLNYAQKKTQLEGVATEEAHKFTLANLCTGSEMDDTSSINSRSQRSDRGQQDSKKSQHIYLMLLEKSNKKQDKQAKKSLDNLKDVPSIGMELSSDEDEGDQTKLKEQNDAVIEEVLSLDGGIKKDEDLLDVPIAPVNLESELDNLNIEEL